MWAPEYANYNQVVPLRVAAISFLNPAPLLYNFEHEPTATGLSKRYLRHYTTPAECAKELQAGTADLGLIPIASLTEKLAVVPGCTIASLSEVRSILLLVKNPAHAPTTEVLHGVGTIAVDAASRSSQAYTHILFERFYEVRPEFVEQAADAVAMLREHDAALLIGDPALMAREHRAEIDAAAGVSLLWLDVAQLWREHTGLPWVAAVWAVRPEALTDVSAAQLIEDCTASRDAGLGNIAELVAEWSPRLGLPADVVRTYLTRNIHYVLDDDCVRAIQLFRELAAEIGILPPLPELTLLSSS